MRKQLIAWLLVISAVMFLPSVVGGHSYMELSSPAPGSTLEEAPTGVWVQFSEPIDTNLSQLRIENEVGDVIEAEQYSVDNSSMTLRLPPLENGEYVVYWQILALDTHVTDGSFQFFVDAEEIEEPVVIEEPVDEEVEEEEQNVFISEEEEVEQLKEQNQPIWPIFSRINTGLRIIDIFAVTLMGGWLFFHRVLWRKEGEAFTKWKKSNHWFEKWLYLIIFFLFIATGFGHMASRSIHLTQTAVTDRIFWQTLEVLFTTTTLGMVSIIKPVVAAVLFAFTFNQRQLVVVIKGLLVILLIATFGYTGHAYHSEQILVHTIHMLALVVWFGGLVGFIVYSFLIKKQPDALRFLHEKLKVFSKIALFLVVIMASSGFVLTNVYLESWSDLWTTIYGQILSWKIGLFALIMVIATCHRFVWLPKLAKVQESEEVRGLVWGLRLELVLIVVVLVIAGMLSTASPPADIHGDHHYYYH